MLRTRIAMGLVLVVILFAPAARGQSGLKLGEKYEGEAKKPVGKWYVAEIPITLEAGQSISLSVTVTGKGRQVFLVLIDPKGTELVRKTARPKTSQLTHEEVPATGKYTILVASDLIGPFTLKATGSSGEELDEKALKAHVEKLEKELAEAKKKLKALQEKKSK